MISANRILVPVDFSKESRQALDWAIKIAQNDKKAVIGLCNVVPLSGPVGPEVMAFDYFRLEKRAALARLARWKRTIPASMESFVVVGHGAIPEEVARICEEKKMKLVVTTTHGRRGLSHLIHGSAAEGIVRLAPCPVLTLHLGQPAPLAA